MPPSSIATQQAEAAMGRAIGVALGLLALVSVAIPWLGLVIGLGVRAFRLAAGF